MPVDDARLLEYFERLTRAQYELLAGLSEGAHLGQIKEEYADLFTRDRVLAEQAAFGAAQGVERLRRRLRLRTVAGGYLSYETRHLLDRIQAWQIRESVELDGETIPLRMVEKRLKNSPDPVFRRRLSDLHAAKATEVQPLLAELWQTLAGLTAELGYAGYGQAFAEWKALDGPLLERLAGELLRETEQIYQAALERFSREYAGIAPGGPVGSDIPWLMRGVEWDRYFPAEEVVGLQAAVIRGLGLGDGALAHVRLDLESREKKTARAFCAAVRVPEEIYLVVKPSGGHRDYEEFLHEMGHALHFAHTNPNLPWERRYVLDDSVCETHAYLAASLLRAPSFLEARLRFDPGDAAGFAAYANFVDLIMVRRYCGKVLFEAAFQRTGDLAQAGLLYAAHMRRVLLVDVPGQVGLLETDRGLYAYQYLNAWFLEAMLRECLVKRFGPRWFDQPEAGAFLRALWAEGPACTQEMLLARTGHEGLTATALAASFRI